jgi:hypothetical protein
MATTKIRKPVMGAVRPIIKPKVEAEALLNSVTLAKGGA